MRSTRALLLFSAPASEGDNPTSMELVPPRKKKGSSLYAGLPQTNSAASQVIMSGTPHARTMLQHSAARGLRHTIRWQGGGVLGLLLLSLLPAGFPGAGSLGVLFAARSAMTSGGKHSMASEARETGIVLLTY